MDTPNETTEFIVFEAGSRLFAVAAEDVAAVAEQRVPARLPEAPPAVLGVVCVRGQMFTVLSALALAGEKPEQPTTVPLIIALNGDEQLALAADRGGESVRIAMEQVRSDTTTTAGSFVHEGRPVVVLDPRQLFATAMGGSERRRRRTL